jgi:hypothetical protein
MTAIDNSISADITLFHLLDALARSPEAPLAHFDGGHAVKTGYHVTEGKAGRFPAPDCWANPEARPELVIQLWDVDGVSESTTPTPAPGKTIRQTGSASFRMS